MKVAIAPSPTEIRRLLGKQLVLTAQHTGTKVAPKAVDAEHWMDEYSLAGVMGSATKAVRSAFEAAISEQNWAVVEDVVHGELERLLPICAGCSRFARRTQNGSVECGRCNPAAYELG